MSSVKVGEEFSDTALLANEDLSDYRVVHFARTAWLPRRGLIARHGPLL